MSVLAVLQVCEHNQEHLIETVFVAIISKCNPLLIFSKTNYCTGIFTNQDVPGSLTQQVHNTTSTPVREVETCILS